MLRKPTLALCGDRSRKAKVNPTSGEPDSWLFHEYLNSEGIEVVGFDFFVNWTELSIPNEIWIKRIIDDQITELSHDDFSRFCSWVRNVDGANYVDKLISFCHEHEISCHYFLFKESSSWNDNPKAIYDVCITNPSVKVLRPTDVQAKIKNLRNVSVPIGPGGLRYGTSSLECYLSNTPYFWPGDVDAFLIDNGNKVRAIIEYKKHNLDTPIEKQTLMNYRDRDRQKYQSLALLRDRFNTSDNHVPIIIIYYPTDSNIKYIKVEKVEGIYNDLQVSHSEIWDIPIRGDEKSHYIFTQKLNNLIK